MKIKFTLKTLLLAICLLLQFSLWAQVPVITLHVEKAGTLSSMIAQNRKYEITDLTLTGNLNGTDILFIREMAGCNVKGNTTNGNLTVLNLADANIVEGGDYYYYYYDTSSYRYYCYTSNSKISDYMFYKTKLVSIILPNSVTSIRYSAFEGCTGLTSITIPNSVTLIYWYAFDGCTGLKEYIVSEENQKYSSLDGGLFNKDKTNLIKCPMAKSGTFSIPNSVTVIGGSAFYGCTGLTSITIPNSVTSIGESAFRGCTGLKEIYSKNSTPPKLVSGCFSNTATCILYVPKGSYVAYWVSPGWGEFKNIIEKDFTAINSINKDVLNIQSISNGIAIDTKETIPVSIFNISGQKVFESTINGYEEIYLPQRGVYIVKIQSDGDLFSKKIIY